MECSHKTYNIYCDESTHLENDGQPYMIYGYVSIPYNEMALAKKQIREIKQKHGYEGELKWTNISDKTFALYNEIVDYFFMTNMKFRAVIVDKSEIDNTRAEYSYNDFIFGCITSYCIIKWTWTAPIMSISTSRTRAANGNCISWRRY